MIAHDPFSERSSSTATVRVLLLGPLRLALGAESCELPFPAEGSQEAFWDAFAQRFPNLPLGRSAIRLVRDHQFLQADELIRPGDELALIPPVSGGASA